jgi:hypothetical protein
MRYGAEMNRFVPEKKEGPSVLDQAYEKAQALLARESINMDEFKEIYGEQQVESDKRYTEELEGKFQQGSEDSRRQKKLATVLEAIFYDQSRENAWLGSGVKTIRPSKYDDYVNGVDCIAEYEEEGRSAFLAMAIDATTGHPGSKFNRIRDDLGRGKLGKVKYFHTDKFSGMLKNIPKVVVGASPKDLEEVMELWVKGDNEALAVHPLQTLILEEIVIQLESFKEFSERRGHTANAKIFEHYVGMLKPILEAKKTSVPLGALKNDAVLTGIKGQLLGFNPPRPTPMTAAA